MKGPIAIFDSGYGGLTILESIRKELPEYDYIYLGDNARAPYGPRSFDVVYEYTLEAVKKLFSLGAHLIILACNTASAKALRSIQQKDLPGIDSDRRVLGVIRPSAEIVGTYTESKHIGVVGTVGTVQSDSYPLEIRKISPDVIVEQEACPMWVSIVENNEFESAGADYFIEKNLNALFKRDPQIDTLILGCTHYPLLLPKIMKFTPTGVKILSQGEIVSVSLKDYLLRHPEMDAKCTKGGNIKFYTTENQDKFRQTAGIFFKGDIDVQHLEL
jgi:glutamate racemase